MYMTKRSTNVAALLTSTIANAIHKALPVSNRSNQMNNAIVPVLDVSFPPTTMIAVANSWHVNKYYYEASEDRWYVIEGASNSNKVSKWIMRPVAEHGKPNGVTRSTSVDLWADRFADRPFNVRESLNGKIEETFEWFTRNFVRGKDIACQLEMYEAYQSRLRYSSSYESLLRLGLTN